MEEQKNPINESLTDTDLDVLSGMMVIFLHSAERIIEIIELEYERRYRAGKEYKQYIKQLGKAATDEIVKREVKHIVRGDERNQLGRILKAGKDFHRLIEVLNKTARNSHKDGVTEWDSFDAIIHDVNILCYIYGLIGNCPNDDDEIKLLSTLKLMAKGDRVSERVLARLKEQVESSAA